MPARKRKKKTLKLKVSPWTAVAAASLLLAAVFLLFRRGWGPAGEVGAKVPSGTWRYGIDISHNNAGPIVWDSLFVMTDQRGRTVRDPFKAKDIKPVSFVFIKATEGATHRDPDFSDNWKEAGKAGLRRGAYHFFRSSKDGEVQARNFIRTVGDLRFRDLPPVLDIETMHPGCTRQLLNKRAMQWLETVEKHYGKKPIVYASSSFITDNLSEDISGNYPIWVAHYSKDRPSRERWTWWQVTDRAVVMGVPGRVDLSVTKAD